MKVEPKPRPASAAASDQDLKEYYK